MSKFHISDNEQAIDSFGKNLSLYLSIGEWLVITLMIYMYNKLERPQYFNYISSFEYIG